MSMPSWTGRQAPAHAAPKGCAAQATWHCHEGSRGVDKAFLTEPERVFVILWKFVCLLHAASTAW